MTRDDIIRMAIIRMAREAGGADITAKGFTSWVGKQSTEFLERFADLVAAYEREACAKVCDEVIRDRDLYLVDGDGSEEVLRCAAAIRKRGEVKP